MATDTTPKHSDQHAQLLFAEQQFFMYSVLIMSLQTDTGKELVKGYEDDALIRMMHR